MVPCSFHTLWIHHGEGLWSSDPVVASSSRCEDDNASSDKIDQMLLEAFGMYDTCALGEDEELKDELDIDAETYYKLVNDASKELYPGCKFSNLQFLVRLLNIKNIGGVSDNCFDELLSLIKDALPNGVALPKNFHDAKKFVKAIGVSYECIDTCPNDCILVKKQYADATICHVCLSLQQNREDTVVYKNLHKKQRKFQTPLPKGGLTVFKRGLEVGLISPQSTNMVAFATIQATDSKSKATDGQPLGDCVEVLINTVFSKTTLLPRSQGNISKLSNAVGRCIQWPRKNVERLHDGSGDGTTPKVSVNGAIKENSSKRRKVKNSSSITSPAICT